MRSTARVLTVLALAGLVSAGAVTAQENASHRHMGHVADGFGNTPDGQGLLPTAVAEAGIAARHAGLAAGDPGDLAAMQRHAGHVLHAIDPGQIESGPGLGYGLKAAAAGVIRHIELAAESEGASEAVQTHSVHVSTAAGNVAMWADEALALVSQIQSTGSASDAAEMVAQLAELTQQIVDGIDANEDGRVGWQEGEGGLAQSTRHMGLMKTAEGLGG